MTLPKKTTAAVLVNQNSLLEIVQIDLPKTLEIGQVLVELFYSGICGSQLGEIDGVKGHDPWLPHLLGHEGVGRVLAVGPGVRYVDVGDNVVLHWKPAKGIEAAPAKYKWGEKIVNAGYVTTFNEHAIISENRLTRISKDADLKTAALYGCAITTGFGVLENRVRVKLGQSIVVFGAGGIGLSIIQAARLTGAASIVAVDRFDNRLEMSKKCGATCTLNSLGSDIWTTLNGMFDSNSPLDVFIDNTGNPEIIAKGFDLVGQNGQVVLVGVPSKSNKTELYTLPLHFGKSIIGTHGGEGNPNIDIPRYMNLFNIRNIDLNEIISEVSSLDNINKLIQNMRSGVSSGRSLIKFI
jgi:S-(hydroxymethyl)glutathione dehydrogenase/alcohol dehydrogenase